MGEEKTTRHRSPRRLLKGFWFLVICAAIVAIVVYSPIFVVRQINVTGNTYLSKDEVCRIAGVYQGEPMFRLETDTAVRTLTKDLRIEQASVRRIMPNILEIQIKERKPAATIACEYGYLDIDHEGMVLDAYLTLKKMPIPMITGISLRDMYVGDEVRDENIRRALTYLQALDEASLNQISEVSLASPEHVIAYTTGAVQIRLGALERLEEKAALTKTFLQDLKTARHPIEYVDFNYTAPFIRFKS